MRHLALGGGEHQQHHRCGSREGRHHLYAASTTETEASSGPRKSPSAHNKGIVRTQLDPTPDPYHPCIPQQPLDLLVVADGYLSRSTPPRTEHGRWHELLQINET
ncbi:unnamed protein product [Urochloa humidicola]